MAVLKFSFYFSFLSSVTCLLIAYPSNKTSSTYSWSQSYSYNPPASLTDPTSQLYRSKGNRYHKAQFKEDIYLYENYFYGITNGIIMESGALDGMLYSTSYMFEHLFSWQTIHIEGNYKHYLSLRQNRNSSINIHAILCNETRKLHYLHRISPSAVDGVLEFMEEKFIQKNHKMYWLKKNTSARVDYIDEIECVPMSELLQTLRVPRVDLWVLDVEGAEYNILQGTFPTKIPINVIMVEIARRDLVSKDKDLVIQLLEGHGYRCMTHQMNEICHRSDFRPSTLEGYLNLSKESLPPRFRRRV